MEINKEKHIHLLLAENKKNSKKKRVSFSIFQAETFEEIEQLRKMKENALNTFQQQKTKTNEYRDMISRNLRVNTSESKSNDSIESDSKNKRKGSKSSVEDQQGKENPILNIKVIKKENDQIGSIKQIEKERKKKEVEDKRKKEDEIEGKKEEDEQRNKIEENVGSFKEQNNQIISNEEVDKQTKINEERIKKEIEEKLRIEIEDKLRKENEERIRKEVEEKLHKENEERIQKENEERIERERLKQIQREKEEQIQREREEQFRRENEERIQRENEDKIQKEMQLKKIRDITILNNSLLSLIFSKKQKQINYSQFKAGSIKYITQKEDDYINYESTNLEYTAYVNKKQYHFSLMMYMISFLSNIRKKISKRSKRLNQIEKANKYKLYCQYKKKAIIFEALYSFGKKQRNWITSIRNELSKGFLWSCLDSLKIYTNYRKIKTYLSLQKKKKLFYSLRKNVRSKYELERKSHTAFLIFIYKNFFSTARRDILIKKGRECDEYISSEYRKQTLLKKVFNLIHAYYSIKKEKMKKTKKLFQVKHQNSEYINIKISQKETIKYTNKNIVTKQISNRINIV